MEELSLELPSPDQIALDMGAEVDQKRSGGRKKKEDALTLYQVIEITVNEFKTPIAVVGDQILHLTEYGWQTLNNAGFQRAIMSRIKNGYRDIDPIIKKIFRVPYGDVNCSPSSSHYYRWNRVQTNEEGKKIVGPMWEGEWEPLDNLGIETVVMADGYLNLLTGQITKRDPINNPVFGPIVSLNIDTIGSVDPDWEEVLNTFLPDKEHREYIQEVFATLLIPHFSGKSFISVYGPPGAGKSTFINAITIAPAGMAGRASCNPDMMSRNQFKAVSLLGRFAAVCEEFENLNVWGKNWLKAYTGGELPFEIKYGSNGVATPSAKFIGVSNTLPDFLEDTQAIMDRMILAPFTHRVNGTSNDDPTKQQKKDMVYWAKHSRRAAVVSWLIEGAKRVARNGFHVQTPEWLNEEKSRIRLETHPVLAFLSEQFAPGSEDDRVTSADLRDLLESQKLPYPRKQIRNLLLEISPDMQPTKRALKEGDKWGPASGFTHLKRKEE